MSNCSEHPINKNANPSVVLKHQNTLRIVTGLDTDKVSLNADPKPSVRNRYRLL